MANYSNPFGTNDTERRNPTTDEYDKGFQCGILDNHLFNGLLYAIQSEIKAVLIAAGLTPTDSDFTQLNQAIDAKIASATGGTPAGYILEDQARSRFPIFPEFLTSDGRINIYSPATGTVRVPGSISFLHRGIGLVTTSETDFPTLASKTYHLRWLYNTGFYLADLSDVAYNPGAAAETDMGFDSTYDDMLVARVTTNSSNVSTITNLANKAHLSLVAVVVGTNFFNPAANHSSAQVAQTINWGRTPLGRGKFIFQAGDVQGSNDTDIAVFNYSESAANSVWSNAAMLNSVPLDRYKSQFRIMRDHMDTLRMELAFTA